MSKQSTGLYLSGIHILCFAFCSQDTNERSLVRVHLVAVCYAYVIVAALSVIQILECVPTVKSALMVTAVNIALIMYRDLIVPAVRRATGDYQGLDVKVMNVIFLFSHLGVTDVGEVRGLKYKTGAQDEGGKVETKIGWKERWKKVD